MAFETLKTSVLPGFLAGFEAAFARDGRKFAAGESITLADFTLHEVLEQVKVMVSELAKEDIFASYPKLSAYMLNFEAIPSIAAYRASPEYLARPFNNKIATWR
jgi:glutathione S-transferase